ncbi:MAG: DUF4292 domain-containing protein [Flavobacteriaceae bacterium]
MKKSILFSFFLLIVFSSCKTIKNVTEANGVIKKMSARRIVKKHLENTFNANTLDSKMRVIYSNTNKEGERTRNTFTVRLRMRKDSVIWIKANKVITVFKAKITPNSFSFYVSIPNQKGYFEGDYSVLKRMLGVDINFTQLQNMLLGQSIFEMKGKKYEAEIEPNAYKLTPKIQDRLFDVFLRINPNHFKLNQLYLTNESKKQSLRVDYKGYKQFNTTRVPIGITMNAIEGLKYTYINLDYKSIVLDKPINIPYRIPRGYKRMVLK